MATRRKISIVAPAYNEESSVPHFYRRIAAVLNEQLKEFDWELIFVNDGSTDNTLAELRKISKGEKRVKILDLSRNFGHQAALTAGLSVTKGDAIVSIDCDLQDPPELIPQMVREWEKGAKVVYARRRKSNEGFFKKHTARLYYKVLTVFSEVKIPRNVGDFRLIDKEVLCSLVRMNERARYLRGMVAWMGYRHAFIDFDRPNRLNGETHYTFRKMVQLGANGVLNFSFLPLRVGFLIGALTVAASLFFSVYMAADMFFYQTEYPLYKWLLVALFGFAGIQFILLWIMGEYIARIYDDVRNRPLYIVNDKINLEEEK